MSNFFYQERLERENRDLNEKVSKLKIFLENKKSEYEKRADEKAERVIAFRDCYERNEQVMTERDEHTREQCINARIKENEFLAIADFISELQEKFFN